MTDASRTRIAVGVAAAIVGTGVLVFAYQHWNGLYDDAYIYFRYVRNLHDGCGLAFNCGEAPVEGFTGPLYLFVLWLASFASDRLGMLCQVVDTTCLILAGGLATAAAAKLATDTRQAIALTLAIAIVLALDPYFQLNAVTGMETALAIACFAFVGFAAFAGRPRMLAVAVCLAWLVRPEAAVFVVALPILPMMRRLRLLAAVAGFVIVVTAIRYAIFDAIVPNTYTAKSGGTARHAAIGLDYIWDAFVDFPLVFFAPLALAGRHRRIATYLLVPTLAMMLFFLRSGGDLFEYSRLVVPLVPALSALALVGSVELAERVVQLRAHAPVVAIVVALGFGVRAEVAHSIPPQGLNLRIVQWGKAGLYAREHFPNATLATVPIGAIGYFSRLPIIDLVGLTDATIAREGRSVPPERLTKTWIGHERNFTEYVLARKPDVIITTEVRPQPWRELREARAGFWSDWLLLQEIKAGRAPYHVHDAEILPGQHMLMLVRDP